jgi:hypothetical protein
MFWTGIGIIIIAGIVVIVVILAKRGADDLGSVSDRWIAEHRVDAP